MPIELQFMDAGNLSNEEIENCREAFSKFDKDGSGSISDWELRAMLQCVPTPNDVQHAY